MKTAWGVGVAHRQPNTFQVKTLLWWGCNYCALTCDALFMRPIAVTLRFSKNAHGDHGGRRILTDEVLRSVWNRVALIFHIRCHLESSTHKVWNRYRFATWSTEIPYKWYEFVMSLLKPVAPLNASRNLECGTVRPNMKTNYILTESDHGWRVTSLWRRANASR